MNIARNDTSEKYWNLKEWARYMPHAIGVSNLMTDAVKAALQEQREEFDESDSD